MFSRAENVDLSLSISQSNFPSNGYEMGDQTFHTPSFGDEDFDIPPINPQQQQPQQQEQRYQQPVQGMPQMNQQEHMALHDSTGSYQQPLYLQGPDHGMVNPSYHNSQPNYSMSPTQQQQNNQLLMIQQQQQQQQQHQQMMMNHGQPPSGMNQYGQSPQHPQGRGNSPPAPPGQEPTTSEDSDDSTPHPAMVATMKRPSPEPADQNVGKNQKKPKVQKKKKKRDPNEPQKPVSAYALFFRDTQAAIKGQNPNASFGEVSKIVASMWDALDSEHKNVYKKKTEAAKKEYLKALAAYRASLVSKGAGDDGTMYGNYNYNATASQYGSYTPQSTIPSPPMPAAPVSASSQASIGKKPMMATSLQQQQQQNMINHMNMQHMQQQHNPYIQQVSQQHIAVPPQQSSPHMQQHVSPPPMASNSPPVPVAAPPPPSIPTGQQNAGQGQMRTPNSCMRHGCPNPAITNSEWEDEYCSNECVVSHCRDVFTNWVAAGNKNPSQNFSTVK